MGTASNEELPLKLWQHDEASSHAQVATIPEYGRLLVDLDQFAKFLPQLQQITYVHTGNMLHRLGRLLNELAVPDADTDLTDQVYTLVSEMDEFDKKISRAVLFYLRTRTNPLPMPDDPDAVIHVYTDLEPLHGIAATMSELTKLVDIYALASSERNDAADTVPSLTQLVSHLHEVKSPLQAVMLEVSMMDSKPRAVQRALAAFDTALELHRSFFEQSPGEWVSLSSFLNVLRDISVSGARRKNIVIAFDFPEELETQLLVLKNKKILMHLLETALSNIRDEIRGQGLQEKYTTHTAAILRVQVLPQPSAAIRISLVDSLGGFAIDDHALPENGVPNRQGYLIPHTPRLGLTNKESGTGRGLQGLVQAVEQLGNGYQVHFWTIVTGGSPAGAVIELIVPMQSPGPTTE